MIFVLIQYKVIQINKRNPIISKMQTKTSHLIYISTLFIILFHNTLAQDPPNPHQGQIQSLQHQVALINTQIRDGILSENERMQQLQKQTEQSIEKLQQIDKELKSWSDFLKRFNQIVSSFNTFLTSFNDKVTTVMTRVVGFEQELKAIVSMDTLIVCILSLILVKILKDEFIEEGYQPVGGLSQHQPLSANSAVNTNLTDRDLEA